MRLKINKSRITTSLYVIKSTYENGVRGTKTVERLGTLDELKIKLNGRDPFEWAKQYIAELNRKEKENKNDILVKCSPVKQIPSDQRQFNGGYLFLQKIYHELGLDTICTKISKKYSFDYDLSNILSRLLYARVIYPSSKLATFEQCKCFIEQPNFELHDVYRALDVIAKESDFIQAELYKNSTKIKERNTGVLFYDCTNFFFEMEKEDGLKQYGVSKEHRPNPIVQMGLFLDGDGTPLAFCINPGNTNEQTTLKPLEKQIISDFGLSKFVVCTDAGLASTANRRFNDFGGRAFVTTQSIKKLKGFLKEWALDAKGWSISGSNKLYDISKIDEDVHKETVFYKERWINENNIEQRLIVSFSLKTRNYQRNIRQNQIERAEKLIASNPKRIGKANQNDYKRLISATNVTTGGEIAEKALYAINQEQIESESRYDGYYGVCTNLEDEVNEIIAINQRRWEIEESFRIMKSELKSRPVYLSRDDRIKAHFTTCFMSLLLFRMLENRLKTDKSCYEIIETLRGMNFLKISGEGYMPTYARTELTDKLHDEFGFRTDYEIVTLKNMTKIQKSTRKEK